MSAASRAAGAARRERQAWAPRPSWSTLRSTGAAAGSDSDDGTMRTASPRDGGVAFNPGAADEPLAGAGVPAACVAANKGAATSRGGGSDGKAGADNGGAGIPASPGIAEDEASGWGAANKNGNAGWATWAALGAVGTGAGNGNAVWLTGGATWGAIGKDPADAAVLLGKDDNHENCAD